MWQDRTRWVLVGVLFLAVALVVVFGVLSSRQTPPPPSPTVDIGKVQTAAVLSFADGLTSTAEANPSSTAAATETPQPAEPTATEVPGTPGTASVSPTPPCYKLKYLQDITIPDYTIMTPAQVFTKTWQVENSGTCPWPVGSKLVLIGGVAMGASPYTVEASVNPGAKVTISLKMAAPTNQTGVIQGTWAMFDPNGNAFGGEPVTVVIVEGATPGAPTAAPTATP